MDLGVVIYIFRTSVFQVIMLAMPVLLIGMLVGLIISIIQATTSLQEQTLSFVPKIVAILTTLIFLGPWMMSSLSEFTKNMILMIPQVAR
ncbi:MAG: flagellar biosynthesis protein FliQ [Spirochaetaceae bacterium]|nr:flagellar biosynthesis protein FliQ [Spirochaetaceae bacterium]